MRTFETGATRDTDQGKIDYEGFLSPEVLKRFGEYMLVHQKQADGNLRPSDNWKKGIPQEQYMKSLLRHTMDLWLRHRGTATEAELQDTLCAIMFNAMGYLFEDLRKPPITVRVDIPPSTPWSEIKEVISVCPTCSQNEALNQPHRPWCGHFLQD